jgi:hypothetical protein
MKVTRRIGAAITGLALCAGMFVTPAAATPVCTDGYEGGPPLATCGGRVFPEAEIARTYVQYLPDPAGFAEFEHGLKYLAELYPRWISVFSLAEFVRDGRAKTAGEDGIRSYEKGDSEDGFDIWVVKITDHKVPDKGKETMFFSQSVHGNERGGLEGALRTAEDLAIAAENGGTITDGVEGYESTTGREPKFHEYEVKDVLAKEIVYFADFNIDGWQVGDNYHQPPLPYERGNGIGTDLNRQMPTIGRINENRNPLQESEMRWGLQMLRAFAAAGRGGLMAHATDVHGELNSNAYVDIMYPAGQFDSVDHRRLMAIAERTKSVIDATLYEGIIDEAESQSGGDAGNPASPVPVKPAHWGTVWDTLGYTDTGFIGDFMATDLAVTGMDYEFFLNHSVPDKAWNVYMQENHINGTRAIIKTAMAYAFFQRKEFNASNVRLDPGGRVGYVLNEVEVTDTDKFGPGRLPGPGGQGIGADGKRITQRPYSVSNMKWFKDTNRLMDKPFVPVKPARVAVDGSVLNGLDILVAPDNILPADASGRRASAAPYFRNLKTWVKGGGTLVLTDHAVAGLARMGVVGKGAVQDIFVYQPYSDIVDFEHHMVAGLRPNARQLVETAPLGYCIGNDCSPMTVVDQAAFEEAGGHTVGTTGEARTSIGEVKLGKGVIRIIGGVLPTPTEDNDHRYGLRDYAMTYTGLYVMENSLRVPGNEASSEGGGLLTAFDMLMAFVPTVEGIAQPAL